MTSIPDIENGEALSSARGKINLLLGGRIGRALDVDFANLVSNTVEVTGPALVVTTDGVPLFKYSGSGTTGFNTIPVDVTPPTTKTSPGVPGEQAYDNNYFYKCVAVNTWKRSSMAEWN